MRVLTNFNCLDYVNNNKTTNIKKMIDIRLLVVITVEVHLFPFRTQKLSQLVLMVVHLVDV